VTLIVLLSARIVKKDLGGLDSSAEGTRFEFERRRRECANRGAEGCGEGVSPSPPGEGPGEGARPPPQKIF